MSVRSSDFWRRRAVWISRGSRVLRLFACLLRQPLLMFWAGCVQDHRNGSRCWLHLGAMPSGAPESNPCSNFFALVLLVLEDYCGSGLEGYENFIAVTVSIYRQNMLVAGIIAGCVVLFISVAWARWPYAVWQFTNRVCLG